MKAVHRQLADQPWDTWPEEEREERGTVQWKSLVGSDLGDSSNMVMGVVRARKGEVLRPHRHSEPETYFVLSGKGLVGLDDQTIAVTPGTTLYIPGDALHSIDNPHDEELLILYTFAVDGWDKVVYRFEPRS